MKYGLSAETLASMEAVFLKHPKIEKVILYGSRAKGNYHDGSDIDLTLVGNKLELKDLYAIDEDLDALDLPYTIDLSLYGQISNEGLIEHIERRGAVFCQKPRGWTVGKLGDVCNVVGGGTPSKANENYYMGNIPWATVRDMNNDILINTQFTISQKAVKCSSTKIISKGNILIATRVGLGKVCYLNQDTAINQDLKAIIPKNDQLLSKHFLFWWLKSIAHTIEAAGTGATVKGVKLPFVKNLDILIPSINEQKRIVTILDQAFADIEKARANAEQNLKNARELFESYLQQVFSQRGDGWVEKTLKDAVVSVSTGPFGSMLHKSDYIKGGIPLVNPINIVGDLIKPNDSKTVTSETAERLKTYILSAGDVVIGRRGEIGRCAVVNGHQQGWVCGTGCFYIKPSKVLNPYFLTHLLRSSKYREELEKVSTGATMKNLSNASIKNLTIAFPSRIEEQERLLDSINVISCKIKDIENIYLEKIACLNDLKKAILQKAFTGELTKKVAE